MLFEPTVLWTLSFCIALCSVEFLLHSVVLGDFGLGLVLEKDEVCDKFWCNRKWRLLYTLQILQRKYQKPCFDCRNHYHYDRGTQNPKSNDGNFYSPHSYNLPVS